MDLSQAVRARRQSAQLMPSSLINVCKMKAVLLRRQAFLQTPNWRPLLGCNDKRKEASVRCVH